MTKPVSSHRLVSAPWLVSMSGPPIPEGAVLVDDRNVVKALGRRADFKREPLAGELRGQGALLPGLVNGHTHLEHSALSGRVAGGDGLPPWVERLWAASATVTSDERVKAAHDAAEALHASGTAALGDVASAPEPTIGAVGTVGLRGMLFHELVGSREVRTGDAVADATREFEDVADRWPQGFGYVLAPHATYSVPTDLLRRIFASAARAGLPTSVHVAEDPDEIALLGDGTGRWPAVLAKMGVPAGTRVPHMAPVAYLASLGAFDAVTPPLLVHMTFAGAEDLRLARKAGATVVLCPRSNQHIGGRLPDVPAILAAGLALALGTDSLASAPDLSLWGEMALLRERFPLVGPFVWLVAATRSAAEAMRLPALGTIAPGKRPGIIDVSIDDAAAPIESLVSHPRPAVRWMVAA